METSLEQTPLNDEAAARLAESAKTNSETVLHFEQVLGRLALSPQEQLATKPTGICLACDLVNDFEDASLTTIGLRLPMTQKQQWEDIRGLLKGMDGDDLECNNDAVVMRPAWKKVREAAGEFLRWFRWVAASGCAGWTAEPSDLVGESRRILGAVNPNQ